MWKFIVAILIAISMHLNAEIKVLAFAGSTATHSINKKLITLVTRIAQQEGAIVTLVDLTDYPMPFYNADLEAAEGMPENARKFRRLMIENDVILIASPEYNHSFTALLKNTIDWASRSETASSSRQAFQGKLFGLMSTSPGKGGGANGLMHLRVVINDIKGIVSSHQYSLPQGHIAFDEAGALRDQNKQRELESFIRTILLEKLKNKG